VATDLGWRHREAENRSAPTQITPPAIDDSDASRTVYGWLRRSEPDKDEFWVPVCHLPFTIGRTSRNRLRLRNPHISRSHAVIEQVGDELCIRDQGSFNGTFVNDMQIQSVPLKDGDRIAIGNIELTFQVLVEASAVSTS